MTERNTIARSLHDLGLAAWFGGSLMGAVGLDGAVARLSDPEERSQVVTTAWGRWGPVNAAAIGAYLIGSVRLASANKARLAGQRGVGAVAVVKAGLTGLALAATGYIAREGLRAAGGELAEAGVEPASESDRLGEATRDAAGRTAPPPGGAAGARARLRAAGWVVPVATGALVAVSAYQGEQQRASQVLAGVLRGTPGRAATAARAARRVPAGRATKTAAKTAAKAGVKAGSKRFV